MKFDIWNDCPKMPLPDVLSFIVDNRGKTVPTTKEGRILIATNCVRNENLYPSYEKIRFLSEETYQNWFRAHPLPGDILFVCKGTPGRCCLVPDPLDFCIAQDMVALRANPDIVYNYFLLAVLRSRNIQLQITNTSVGDVIPHFKKSFFDRIMIPVPPMEIQKVIGDYYMAISNKIELKKKINDKLLQQAQCVFIDWFVRFTPFIDDEFVVSPIETRIPKSLSMMQIADVPHILETGRRPKGGAADSGIPSVGAENVKQLGKFDFSSKKFIPEDFAAKQKAGRINGYELLLYKDGGKPGTFIPHFSMFGEGFPYRELFINEHVFKLDFFDRGKNIFAYFYMQTDYATNWLANNGGKAAIPGINQKDVRAIWIYDMDHPQVQRFCRWVEPLFKTIFCNCYENMRLADLRDTLLPKLMNGEIDVSSIHI